MVGGVLLSDLQARALPVGLAVGRPRKAGVGNPHAHGGAPGVCPHGLSGGAHRAASVQPLREHAAGLCEGPTAAAAALAASYAAVRLGAESSAAATRRHREHV